MAVDKPLKKATSLRTSIEVIPQNTCQLALRMMEKKFCQLFPEPTKVSLIPILRAGRMVGNTLGKATSIKPNFMQMSYYKEDTSRLKKPICIKEPDIKKIIVNGQTRPVVFAEAVVDSQATLLAAIDHINSQIDKYSRKTGIKYSHPTYYVFALISKTGKIKVKVPNLVAMFQVNPDIWVFGCGCDLAHRGRRIKSIRGIISPSAKRIPQPPYFKRLF